MIDKRVKEILDSAYKTAIDMINKNNQVKNNREKPVEYCLLIGAYFFVG